MKNVSLCTWIDHLRKLVSVPFHVSFLYQMKHRVKSLAEGDAFDDRVSIFRVIWKQDWCREQIYKWVNDSSTLFFMSPKVLTHSLKDSRKELIKNLRLFNFKTQEFFYKMRVRYEQTSIFVIIASKQCDKCVVKLSLIDCWINHFSALKKCLHAFFSFILHWVL